MRTSAPAQLPIFRSDLQARLLALLLLTGESEWTVAEMVRRLGGSRAGVHQELRRLLDAGILERRSVGRSDLYRVAEESPLVTPLRQLLEATAGVVPELRRTLKRVRGVDAAVVHGSLASGGAVRPVSDVDVLVVGDPDRDALEQAVREVERLTGRDVDLSVYARDEWTRRVRDHTAFATTVLERPRVALVGDLEAIA